MTKFDTHIYFLQFAPEEYLYRESDIAQEMFIIISGSVEELSETKEVCKTSIQLFVHT